MPLVSWSLYKDREIGRNNGCERGRHIHLSSSFCWLAQTVFLLIICVTLCTIGLLFYPADRCGTLLRNIGKYVRLHDITLQKTVIFVRTLSQVSVVSISFLSWNCLFSENLEVFFPAALLYLGNFLLVFYR